MPITRENLDGDDYRASGFVLHLRADLVVQELLFSVSRLIYRPYRNMTCVKFSILLHGRVLEILFQ